MKAIALIVVPKDFIQTLIENASLANQDVSNVQGLKNVHNVIVK